MAEDADPENLFHAVVAPLLPDVDSAMVESCALAAGADISVCDTWIPVDDATSAHRLVAPDSDLQPDLLVEKASSAAACKARFTALAHPGIAPSLRALALARHHRIAGESEAMHAWYIRAGEMLMSIPDVERAITAYSECADAVEDVLTRIEILELRAMVFTHSNLNARSEAWAEIAELWNSVHPETSDARERYARALFYVYWPAMNEADRASVEQAAELSGAEVGWGWRARALIATLDDDLDTAIEHDTRAVAVARRTGDLELEWLALRNFVSNRSSRGEDVEFSIVREVGQQAEAVANHAVAVESYMTYLAAVADSSCYQECVQPARELLGYVNRRQLQPWSRLVVGVYAEILRICGHVAEAHAAISGAPEPADNSGEIPDLGHLEIVRAFIAIEQGAPVDEVDACLRLAVDRGAASFELYADLVTLARLMLEAEQHGIAHVLERFSEISTTDMFCIAQSALWLARTGVFNLSNEAIAAALDMVERDLVWDAAQTSSYASLCAREIQLIGRTMLGDDQDAMASKAFPGLDEFERMSARWKRAGYELDATRCELVALSLLASSRLAGNMSAAMLARRVITLSDRLREFGVRRDHSVIERLLSGDSAKLKELMETSLAKCRVLEHVDAEARQAFLSSGIPMEAGVGKLLYERGEVPEALYVIASGGVRLVTTDPEGRELTLDALGVGDVFGSIRGESSPADSFAETTDLCMLLVVSQSQVASLRRAHESIAQGLDREADLQRARIRTLAVELAYASAHQRLARLILSLDSRFGHPTLHGDRIVNRRITQNELASMIGTSRKSVSAILGDLRQQDALDLDRKRIVIRDYAAIQRLADGED